MWATMATMYKTEGGFLALYRGIVPTVAGVAPYVRMLDATLYGVADCDHKGGAQFYDIRVCEAVLYT